LKKLKKKIIRTSTVSISLDYLLKGQLAFLRQYYDVIAVSNNDEHLKIVKEREKVKTISVSTQRKISLIKDLISLWNLYLIFKREKPLIVHSITPKAGLLSMVAAYFANVPIRIHTFTGLIFPTKTGLIRKIIIFMDKTLCFFATAVYPEGNGVKNDLINFGITKKPLKIIANGNVNGIDLNYFNPSIFSKYDNNVNLKGIEINENDFVFIFVGRLVRDKGINELISAFLKLKSTSKNLKLLLVGPFENDLDPLNPETIKVIYECNDIIIVGFQPDIRPYLAISDALVFPSYREGFPNVVLQAGAMSLPCIVTDINGSNEIIIEGHNGIIIPVKDEEALIHAMYKLLSDKEYYSVLKTNARKFIISRYEQKIVWEALLEEYKELESNV